KTVLARGVDQMIDEHGAETDAAELWVHHPLDAADETERSAFAAMERGVGDDFVIRPRQQRKDLRIVDVLSPALDQRAVLDMVPGEASVLGRERAKKVGERVDVLLGKGAKQDAALIA